MSNRNIIVLTVVFVTLFTVFNAASVKGETPDIRIYFNLDNFSHWYICGKVVEGQVTLEEKFLDLAEKLYEALEDR